MYKIPADAVTPEITRNEAVRVMTQNGGHFHSALGKALMYADDVNSQYIMQTWMHDIRILLKIDRHTGGQG